VQGATFGTQNSSEIILDFFAGSGTTAHAVMALNAEDGGNRKSISVQLPEHLDKKNQKEAISFLESISKPTNIAEITKERIRRAGRKIKEENPDTTIDTGFKVFRLSESNFKKWDENI
jgi:adenine-specific DNA-methyltransferase